MSDNHTWSDSSCPIKYNPKVFKQVIINDDVWIAAGVKIMPGVTIGRRVVIGAGAVVTKDCIENSVYAGCPAVKIKSIKKQYQ
jgi:acetyltransferase-like isoleucine patch superfamily enzyme